MNRVILDPQTVQALRDKQETLELCDGSGSVIGHFVPADAIRVEPKISEEELDRREKAGGGRPLNEILNDLRKRA